MRELLAKIRGAKRSKGNAKCQLVTEVYAEVSPVLAKLGQSADEAEMKLQAMNLRGEGIDVVKFDAQLDEIEQVLDELKQLFVPPEIKKLLKTLETRFMKNMKRHEGITWQQVKKKLKQAPKEKLRSLNEMEKTGGEPDVINIDKKTGEVIFYDCSEESPTARRNCTYDNDGEERFKRAHPGITCIGNAVDMAKKMGVELLTEEEYRELQIKGEFDRHSWSWLKTPVDKRRNDVALNANYSDGLIDIVERIPEACGDPIGFRGLLRV